MALTDEQILFEVRDIDPSEFRDGSYDNAIDYIAYDLAIARAIEQLVRADAQRESDGMIDKLNKEITRLNAYVANVESKLDMSNAWQAQAPSQPVSQIPASQLQAIDELKSAVTDYLAALDGWENTNKAEKRVSRAEAWMRSKLAEAQSIQPQAAPQDARDKKDAERYRWLRDIGNQKTKECVCVADHTMRAYFDRPLDEVIDAAIAASKQGEAE